jgi:glucose-6-phosphate 1-dehydrogenase
MVKRGVLNVPVVGVAYSKWDLPQLRERVRDSIAQDAGGIVDERALDRLLSLLGYVDGDYNDPGTFEALKGALGDAWRPAFYLAIPPALFETVIEGLGAAGLARGARVIIEKPFGRDLASARELNRVARSVFPEDSIFRIDHFLGKEAIGLRRHWVVGRNEARLDDDSVASKRRMRRGSRQTGRDRRYSQARNALNSQLAR